MLTEYFHNIARVEIYAIIAFFIFFVFFIMVTIHAIKIDKDKINRFSNIPLEDGYNTTMNNQKGTL